MNDIKDLLISRISDIKFLFQQKVQLSYTKNQPGQSTVFRGNLHHLNTQNASDPHERLESQSYQSSSPSKSCSHNIDSDRDYRNQRQNKISALMKKKQKARNFKESKAFNSVSMLSFHNDRQIQEFYFHFIDIFASFDNDFTKYKNPAHFLTLSMGQNLKKVFSFFFLKHEEPQKCKQLIPEVMSRQILDLSPAFFLGWIRKWSTSILNSLLNLNEDKNECKIDLKVDLKKIQDKILNRNFVFDPNIKNEQNNFNFITKKKSPRESPNKAQKQTVQKKSNSFRTIVNNLLTTAQANQVSPQINVNSKEMVYAHCLDDMKKYYKNFPLEDLDIGYLRNIKKIGKKQDLFSNQNIKNTVEVLIQSKNSDIKNLMTQFQSHYAKFKQNNGHYPPKIDQTKNTQISQILTQENDPSTNQESTELKKNSLKDLSIKNLKNLFDLNSKLLTPSLNQRQTYKNRIKFSNMKNQQILLCQNLTNLTGQLLKQSSHSSFVDKSQKQAKIIDYNSVLTQQITQESCQIQNKIKLLKRINNKNKDLKDKYFGAMKKANCQQKNPQNQMMDCFIDEHIEPNQKISKFPKIISRDKTIEVPAQSPQDFQINGYKNFSVQKRKKQHSLEENRLNKSSISRQNKRFFKQQNRASQQFIALNLRKSTAHQKAIDQLNLNRRFLSQTAEKQSALNTSIEDNQRPLSNFSFKSKAFGGSNKSSFNVMKLAKNKNYMKNEFGEIQNVQAIHEKIKSKFGIKENPTLDMKSKTPSNIFTSQKGSFKSEENKDDFIRYLKNLENQKFLSQKSKCFPSKQKQRQIKRKFP